jgi:hypothetical protein
MTIAISHGIQVIPFLQTIRIDELVKSRRMAMEKGPEARHSVWPGVKDYIEYVERLAKHYDAAYGTSKEVPGQKMNYHTEFILNNSILEQTGLTHFLSGMWPPRGLGGFLRRHQNCRTGINTKEPP